jgi:hypothetical protein
LGNGVRQHIGFSDLAKAEGTEEKEKDMAVFRQVRDSIENRVLSYLLTL